MRLPGSKRNNAPGHPGLDKTGRPRKKKEPPYAKPGEIAGSLPALCLTSFDQGNKWTLSVRRVWWCENFIPTSLAVNPENDPVIHHVLGPARRVAFIKRNFLSQADCVLSEVSKNDVAEITQCRTMLTEKARPRQH